MVACETAVPVWAIYQIENLLNGKKYFGQTRRSVEIRWREHCRNSRMSAVTRAIRKYGPGAFSVSLIALRFDKMEADALERELIACKQTRNPDFGYNITLGGEGNCRTHCKAGHELAGERCQICKKAYLLVYRQFWKTKDDMRDYARDQMRRYRVRLYADSQKHKEFKQRNLLDAKERYRNIKAQDPVKYAAVLAAARIRNQKRYWANKLTQEAHG